MDLLLLKDWVPIRCYWQAGQAMVDWCYLGDLRFTEPFFDQTIGISLRRPANMLFRHQTPIEVLGELHATRPGLAPSGLIFHMSRCGSTLIAQTLAALPQQIVLSEAAPIDMVLRSQLRDPSITDEQRSTWVRWLVSAYGQRRSGEEQRYFIKLDSWHTLFLPLLRRIFPDVPWIFVYRDPVEVMVSHQRQRGPQVLPGVIEPQLVGLDLETVTQLSQDEYCAIALARICQAAADHVQHDPGLLLNYRELPGAIWSRLPAHVGVSYSEAEQLRLRQAAQLDAKNPVLPFNDDRALKQQLASASVRELAERWLQPVYQQLEQLRLAQL